MDYNQLEWIKLTLKILGLLSHFKDHIMTI